MRRGGKSTRTVHNNNHNDSGSGSSTSSTSSSSKSTNSSDHVDNDKDSDESDEGEDSDNSVHERVTRSNDLWDSLQDFFAPVLTKTLAAIDPSTFTPEVRVSSHLH